MPISAILFDKDGTLFDFQPTWGAWAESALAHLSGGDASVMSEMADLLDYDFATRRFRPESFVIAGTSGEIADALAGILTGRTREDILIEVDRLAASVVPVEAVPLDPFLEKLRALGLPLGIATNDSEAVAYSNLDHCGREICCCQAVQVGCQMQSSSAGPAPQFQNIGLRPKKLSGSRQGFFIPRLVIDFRICVFFGDFIPKSRVVVY